MRKPWQQPPPPKKEILRAKQKQKPVVVGYGHQGPAGVAFQPFVLPPLQVTPRSPQTGFGEGGPEQRKEWREGLKAHIEQQRVAAKQVVAFSSNNGID